MITLKKVIAGLLMFSVNLFADVITTRTNFEVTYSPKMRVPVVTKPGITLPVNPIIPHLEVRRRLDNKNLSFTNLGIQYDTLKKDEPWKIVLVQEPARTPNSPTAPRTIDLPKDVASIEVLGSSSIGAVNQITKPVMPREAIVIGTMDVLQFVKIKLNLNGELLETYGTLNIKYNVIRNITGDHWVPTGVTSLRTSGVFALKGSSSPTNANLSITVSPPTFNVIPVPPASKQ